MTKRLTLLYLLREAGERGVTTGEILQAGVGSRYGARLLELREEGFVVEAVRERQSSFRYTLVAGPDRAVGFSAPPTGGASGPVRAGTLFDLEPRTRSHYEGAA